MNGVYTSAYFGNLLQARIDQKNGNICVGLFTSSLGSPPDLTAATYASIATFEVSSSGGSGYVQGGKSLANLTLTFDGSGNRYIFSADTIVWNNASFTARYAVVFFKAANGDLTASYPMFLIDFGSDKTVNAGDFTIQWDSVNGIATYAGS